LLSNIFRIVYHLRVRLLLNLMSQEPYDTAQQVGPQLFTQLLEKNYIWS
jgi:hypothetical protein